MYDDVCKYKYDMHVCTIVKKIGKFLHSEGQKVDCGGPDYRKLVTRSSK